MKTLYQLPFTDLTMKFFDKENSIIYKVPLASTFATSDNSLPEHVANYTERLTKLIGEFEIKPMYEDLTKPLSTVDALPELPKSIQKLFKNAKPYKTPVVQYAYLTHSNAWRGAVRAVIESFFRWCFKGDPFKVMRLKNKPLFRYLNQLFVNDREYIRQLSTATYLSVVVNKDNTKTAIQHLETALYSVMEDLKGYLYSPVWIEVIDKNGVDKNVVLTCAVFLTSNASKYMRTLERMTPEEKQGTWLDHSLVAPEGRLGLDLSTQPAYEEITIGI